ncbi:hypothetical protein NPIL_365431 [Nephila pilipes]|uniref:Uncharacterized protein n=1 Tax=Nephila pilipes TaxID=299642 RepID=A0A8X6NFK0_NEPPI|nr:hypothetical protein NPIL_365431 [Nephila pilipes]
MEHPISKNFPNYNHPIDISLPKPKSKQMRLTTMQMREIRTTQQLFWKRRVREAAYEMPNGLGQTDRWVILR